MTLQTVLDLRGDWLMRDDRCHEAALSYTLAGKPRKAMIAHQRALTWRELFDIAVTEQLSAEELATLAEHVGDALKAKGRHAEAGQVFLDYAKDVKNAVIVLSDGNEFAEAIRIVSLPPSLRIHVAKPSQFRPV
jgi:elongator complex protein 1